MRRPDEMIGDVQIECLPIPSTAIAFDIGRRQDVWLNRSSLSKAIRALIAFPGLFTPVEYDNRLLVDGGLLSPLSLAPAQYQDSNQTIAVSLNGSQHDGVAQSWEEEQSGMSTRSAGMIGRWMQRTQQSLGIGGRVGQIDALGIVARSLEAMQDRIARIQGAAYRPGILIKIPAHACGVLDFHVAERMIDLGYRRTKVALGSDSGSPPGTRAGKEEA